jgi:[citrate (pro-3S)-lyase] ligase
VIESHALLDLGIFIKISESLGINRRYVGEEPTSQVTAIYNEIMKERLPEAGIECIIIPRKEAEGTVISASTVRKLIKEGDFSHLTSLLPETTIRFFESPEAEPIIKKIKEAEQVIHY